MIKLSILNYKHFKSSFPSPSHKLYHLITLEVITCYSSSSSESLTAGSGTVSFVCMEEGRLLNQPWSSSGITISLQSLRRSAFFSLEIGKLCLYADWSSQIVSPSTEDRRRSAALICQAFQGARCSHSCNKCMWGPLASIGIA